jgi:hypothetical protein
MNKPFVDLTEAYIVEINQTFLYAKDLKKILNVNAKWVAKASNFILHFSITIIGMTNFLYLAV